jgi:hypothetical protein
MNQVEPAAVELTKINVYGDFCWEIIDFERIALR